LPTEKQGDILTVNQEELVGMTIPWIEEDVSLYVNSDGLEAFVIYQKNSMSPNLIQAIHFF